MDFSTQRLFTIYEGNSSSWLGKQDAVFTCPTAIIYKFYLPGAMGQAPMSSPVNLTKFCPCVAGSIVKNNVKIAFLI